MITRRIFDSDHDVFCDAVRKFLMDEAYEQHAEWEKEGQIDRNFLYKAGEQGMFCPGVSEEYGGVGADFRYNMVIGEEVSPFRPNGYRIFATQRHHNTLPKQRCQ